MCSRCDRYADEVEAGRDPMREAERCPEGEHDYGEAADYPDGLIPDKEVHCQNCGWSLADIKAKEKADDGS